ncbi:MAG: ornithine carbamoyltransferase, partial [Armatimonadota bacterium]
MGFMTDLNPNQARVVLDLAHGWKQSMRRGEALFRFARPTAFALIFEKSSLRTRTTFEVGLYQMGA